MGILDLIFPKRCINCQKIGEYLCPNCFIFLSFETKPICLACGKQSINNLTHKACLDKSAINGYFSALSPNKLSYKLISKFKSKPYLSNLANFLGELFYESLIQNENFIKQIENKDWLIVPMYSTKLKLKKRGYNHAELLAKRLSIKLKISLVLFSQADKYKNKNILLVDDVVKSGFSLQSVTKLLKQGGAKMVLGLTLIGGK